MVNPKSQNRYSVDHPSLFWSEPCGLLGQPHADARTLPLTITHHQSGNLTQNKQSSGILISQFRAEKILNKLRSVPDLFNCLAGQPRI